MYVKLSGRIEITRTDGSKLSFTSFNEVEYEKDIFKINSWCKIKIPTSARLKYKGKQAYESVQTAKQFNRGDRVKVWLGYNDDLKLEYDGFIHRVNYKVPLEIECEGYEYLLRSPCETRTWGRTNLAEVLNYLIEGTEISLDEHIPEIGFDKYIIPANMNRLEALQVLKETYGITIYFMASNLYAGLAYTIDNGTVKYKLGDNTIKEDALVYRNADDVSLKIKAVWIKPNNTKLEVEVGDPKGSQRTLFFYNVSSEAELRSIATEEVTKYKYSGYEGKITTFLQPFAVPGMKAQIDDPKYHERTGKYYISKVGVKAGRGGGRRSIEITVKL